VSERRQPTDTRRIPNNPVRHVISPRWVASYYGSPHGGLEEGHRCVGLPTPRTTLQSPNGRSLIAHTDKGEVMEFPIGYRSGPTSSTPPDPAHPGLATTWPGTVPRAGDLDAARHDRSWTHTTMMRSPRWLR